MSGPPLVRIERHGDGGHVAELVLDRPEAMNAVSTAMAAAIAAATPSSPQTEVRAVVVSSHPPKAPSASAPTSRSATPSPTSELRAQRPVARAAYGGVLDLPVPVVAAVDGYALGGGFEIALSCDLVVCGEDAVVGLPEVSVGVIPGGGGTQLLTRRVGWSRAASMIFTARRLTAAEARDLGVVDEVVPAGSARERALELATTIAATPRSGVRNAKRAMRRGSTPTWPPVSTSRTSPGPPRRSPRTAPKGSRPSTKNAVRVWPGR